MTDRDFARSARHLGGDAALLLGWRPNEFWSATPADLLIALEPLRAMGRTGGMDPATMHNLQEQFPDG